MRAIGLAGNLDASYLDSGGRVNTVIETKSGVDFRDRWTADRQTTFTREPHAEHPEDRRRGIYERRPREAYIIAAESSLYVALPGL